VGVTLAVSGSAPMDSMWEAVCTGREIVRFENGFAYSTTASVNGIPCAHLAVWLRRAPTNYDISVIRFATRVMQMIRMSSQAAVDHTLVARASLLRELMEANSPDQTLLDRLQAVGFDPAAKVRVLVGRARLQEPGDTEGLSGGALRESIIA